MPFHDVIQGRTLHTCTNTYTHTTYTPLLSGRVSNGTLKWHYFDTSEYQYLPSSMTVLQKYLPGFQNLWWQA